MSCDTCFYGSFVTKNSMVTFIFTFDPRNGQFQVKLGQIRSNFKTPNFLTKICFSCAVLSQDSNNVIHFYVRQLKCQNFVSKMRCHHLHLVFWPLHSQQQRHCFKILYAYCLYVSPDTIYSVFRLLFFIL